MKVTLSNLLRCGFTLWQNPKDINSLKGYFKNHLREDKFLGFLEKNHLRLSLQRYDSHLGGEIDIYLKVFKCKLGHGKHCYVLMDENKNLKVLDSIEYLSLWGVKPNNDLGFVYVIKSEKGYKIGCTKNIDQRARLFGVKIPMEWSFYKIYMVENHRRVEKNLHRVFKPLRGEGEWFNLDKNALNAIDNILNSPT